MFSQVLELPTNQLLTGKKVIGIYFSASWCGPCQRFTPELVKFYSQMRKDGRKFEIVWISHDKSVDEFAKYFQKMPWLAVTVNNVRNAVESFNDPKYGLKGIPHLVLLDGDDGSVITKDGRSKVISDKYGLEFPWRERSIAILISKLFKKGFRTKIFSVIGFLRAQIISNPFTLFISKKLAHFYKMYVIEPTLSFVSSYFQRSKT